MPRKPALAMSLLVFLATTACSSQSPMDKQPNIKLNPHPRHRYEITVTTDAPGPFDKVTGGGAYQVSNVECVPAGPLTGGRDVPNTIRDSELTRVGEKTYRGYFYEDLLQDEDYFGLGVCHWAVTSAGASFEVHGMTFGAGLVMDKNLEQKSVTEYTPKETYFDPSEHVRGFSAPMNDYIAKNQGKFFSITVTVRRADP